MNRGILFFSLAFLLLASEAGAQEITAFAGYLNPGELNLGTLRSDLNFRGTGIYGARFEFDFHRFLGLDQDVAFSPRLFQSSLIPGGASDVKGFLYSSNLVVNLPIGHFVPYATAGIGFMKPFGSEFIPFDVRFASNYGGGVKLERLVGPMGLVFDVRDYRVSNVADNTLNLLQASGGLTFTFGRKH